jgi:hypothetical protein
MQARTDTRMPQAAEFGYVEVVRALLHERPAGPRKEGGAGLAGPWAVAGGVCGLDEEGRTCCGLDDTSDDGWTALMFAAKGGHVEVVRSEKG